jgi:hypothetical protein
MSTKLTRLTHKIVIQLHVEAESGTICSSRSRRLVRKLLVTPLDIRPILSNVTAVRFFLTVTSLPTKGKQVEICTPVWSTHVFLILCLQLYISHWSIVSSNVGTNLFLWVKVYYCRHRSIITYTKLLLGLHTQMYNF